jgi:DNA-binding response OmpR family regulator
MEPSCPILVIHEDDAWRKSLIAALDQRHFTVTYVTDGDAAVGVLEEHRPFRVMIIGVNLESGSGTKSLDWLRANGEAINGAAVIVVGEPNPELRNAARSADETLLMPVDPAWVAERARTYCR